jgi:hypothetical protein
MFLRIVPFSSNYTPLHAIRKTLLTIVTAVRTHCLNIRNIQIASCVPGWSSYSFVVKHSTVFVKCMTLLP